MSAKSWPLAAIVLAAAACHDKASDDVIPATSTLTLVQERSFAELLSGGRALDQGGEAFEASGVTLDDGALRVVFDNRTEIASVDLDLGKATLGPGKKSRSQYEGITVRARPEKRMYAVKEVGAGGRGAIVTLDPTGRVLATEPTDLAFADESKGLEGIAWLDAEDRLLVLCEDRGCGVDGNGSARGRSEGGVIKALRHEGDAWETDASLSLPLPDAVDFEDFSDLAVMKESPGVYRVAVLSQRSSALWLGTLSTSPPAIVDAGTIHVFPGATRGSKAYCALEGVTFIERETFGLVSDRPKDAGDCAKVESVHVFRLAER